jgi:putative transposase
MNKLITKPASSQPATGLAVDLFDNWFDPIESEPRVRSLQFIEELIRDEPDAALARPHGAG